ncbi:hypothetical protein E4H12_04615 [Candidatus Thorarchaeota archaeon]|nr:MAG: hypothetical protein E4H12_04615 [Candidatus Thorarchaeota archaeon]
MYFFRFHFFHFFCFVAFCFFYKFHFVFIKFFETCFLSLLCIFNSLLQGNNIFLQTRQLLFLLLSLLIIFFVSKLPIFFSCSKSTPERFISFSFCCNS